MRVETGMGALFGIYSWGIILQALAVLHFIKRRPNTYWIFIIIFGGGIGALIYLLVEALPDAHLLRHQVQGFSRRGRIRQLETVILDNPSAGNLEELGDLYLDEGKYARAREYFTRAISSRSDSRDAFYRRAICAMELGDYTAAIPDLELVVAQEPKYDFYRAIGLLAHAYARAGQAERAEAMFQRAIAASTLSETQYNYACFLAAQNRSGEARDLAQRILGKKATMPGYLKRRERPWFRGASSLLKRLPA